MPDPPLVDHRDFIKILIAEGFIPRKHGGSHQVFKRVGPVGTSTVSVPTGDRVIKRGTMRSILKLLGWTVDDLQRLMEKHL